jgi:fucose permease
MNVVHGAFTVGAIVGPLGVAALLAVGLDWRLAFRATALLAAALSIPLLAVRLPAASPAKHPAVGDARERGPFREPLVIVTFLALLIYVGVEMGISSWVGELFVVSYARPPQTAAGLVALFWAGLLIGRFGLGAFYTGNRFAVTLTLLASLATAGVILTIAGVAPGLAAVGVGLAGLGCSAYYPVAVSLMGREFPHHQGLTIGFVAAGGGVGALVLPFIMANVADRVGVARGFRLFGALGVVLVGLSLLTVALARHRDGLHARRVAKTSA